MRQNSLLTETQREFLNTTDEEKQEKYTKQQRSYHRQGIHDRLRSGIKDFPIILEHREGFDIDSVFKEEDPKESAEIRRGLVAMVALLYGGARDFCPPSERLIEQSVEQGARKWFDQTVKADLSVEPVEVVNIPQVCDVVNSGGIDELTDLERRWVLEMVAEGAELTGESLCETH